MSETSKLKDRGNTAYKAKKFEEAIDFFKQAVLAEEASPSKDSKVLAILHSNVAQAYVELKK
jgi:tetratricopeptide (TPR) repeat protein